jgi:hypothetical protein
MTESDRRRLIALKALNNASDIISDLVYAIERGAPVSSAGIRLIADAEQKVIDLVCSYEFEHIFNRTGD